MNEQICPLTITADRFPDAYCKGYNCAWFNGEQGQCAMLNLSESLEDIADSLAQHE